MNNKYLLYGAFNAQETETAIAEAKSASIYSEVISPSSETAEERRETSEPAAVKTPESVAPADASPIAKLRREAGAVLADLDMTTFRKKERLRHLARMNPGNAEARAIIDEAIKNVR